MTSNIRLLTGESVQRDTNYFVHSFNDSLWMANQTRGIVVGTGAIATNKTMCPYGAWLAFYWGRHMIEKLYTIYTIYVKYNM